MAFETQPFNLGNTLARAAQITESRDRNALNRLRINKFNKDAENDNAALEALRNNKIDELARGDFGKAGIELGNKSFGLQNAAAQLRGTKRETFLDMLRAINKNAKDARASEDPRQFAQQGIRSIKQAFPEASKVLQDIDFSNLSDQELDTGFQTFIAATEFSVDPVQTARIVSSTKQFREGDEFVTRSQTDGVPDTSDAGVIARSPIDRVSRVEQGGPGDFDVNRKQINTEAVESANESSALRRDLLSTLPEVEANKKSVGIRGNVGLGLGGVVTNILGEAAGDEVTRAIAGNDQKTLASIQTRLTTLRSRLRPIVTGEGGARQSETERQIAGKAIGFIDQIKGPADLSRSFPQVVGAMRELVVATLENEFEQAAITPAVAFPFDLNTREGVIALGTELSGAGFSLEEAIRARDRLLRIQNQ